MKLKRIGAFCAAIGMTLMLSGCGVAANGFKTETSVKSMMEPAVAPEVHYITEYDADYAYRDYGYEAPADMKGSGMVSYSTEDGGTFEENERAQEQDKIIYTCDANVETIDFDESVARTYELINRYGGFIQNSYITGKDYYTQYYHYNSYRTANFTIRVPRESFSAFKGSLDALGSVTYSSVSANNISTAYHDTESRLKSCRTQEARLLELIEEANTVDEILQIEARLSDVRYEIEAMTTQITNWDSKINYSTVNLNLNEVSKLTEEKPVQPTFGEELLSGIKASIEWIAEAAKDGVVFLVSALPFLVVPVMIIVVLVIFIRGRRNKKRKAIRAESENDVKVDD